MALPTWDGRERERFRVYRKRFQAYVERYGEFTGADLWSGLSGDAEAATELLEPAELARRGGWKLLLDTLEWHYGLDPVEELDEACAKFFGARRENNESHRAFCLRLPPGVRSGAPTSTRGDSMGAAQRTIRAGVRAVRGLPSCPGLPSRPRARRGAGLREGQKGAAGGAFNAQRLPEGRVRTPAPGLQPAFFFLVLLQPTRHRAPSGEFPTCPGPVGATPALRQWARVDVESSVSII